MPYTLVQWQYRVNANSSCARHGSEFLLERSLDFRRLARRKKGYSPFCNEMVNVCSRQFLLMKAN